MAIARLSVKVGRKGICIAARAKKTKYINSSSLSFLCFCKDYPDQCDKEKRAIMYHSPKESRPFCNGSLQSGAALS